MSVVRQTNRQGAVSLAGPGAHSGAVVEQSPGVSPAPTLQLAG